MTHTAKILRYVAFAMMALFGLLGALFVAGEAFDDPGGWAAVGMTAAWAVPLVAMITFVVRRPGPAAPVLVAVTGLAVVFALADAGFGLLPRDSGPVTAVAAFAVGVALAFLGLRRATLAGALLLLTGFVQVIAARGHLGGSSGAVGIPLVVAGFLFLLAGRLEHEPLLTDHPAHAVPPGRAAVGLAEAALAMIAVAAGLFGTAFAIGGADATSDNWVGISTVALGFAGLLSSLAALVLGITAKVRHQGVRLLWLPLTVFPAALVFLVLGEAFWWE